VTLTKLPIQYETPTNKTFQEILYELCSCFESTYTLTWNQWSTILWEKPRGNSFSSRLLAIPPFTRNPQSACLQENICGYFLGRVPIYLLTHMSGTHEVHDLQDIYHRKFTLVCFFIIRCIPHTLHPTNPTKLSLWTFSSLKTITLFTCTTTPHVSGIYRIDPFLVEQEMRKVMFQE